MGAPLWVTFLALIAPALCALQWTTMHDKLPDDVKDKKQPLMFLMTKSGGRRRRFVHSSKESRNKRLAVWVHLCG
jgi:hypothetical protein